MFFPLPGVRVWVAPQILGAHEVERGSGRCVDAESGVGMRLWVLVGALAPCRPVLGGEQTVQWGKSQKRRV